MVGVATGNGDAATDALGAESNGAAFAGAVGATDAVAGGGALGATGGRANGVTFEPAPCSEVLGAFATGDGGGAELTTTCVAA